MTLRHWQILAFAIMAAVATATAQPVRTQSRGLLDADLRVGIGRNPRRSGERPFDSQLYITGQVTGLSGFGGRSPYYAADQLRLDLPSAGLGTFRQQSVGLQEVLTGSTHTASPYYERTSTAFGLRGIQAGLTSPGSDTPRVSTPAGELVRRLYPELVRTPSSTTGAPGARRLVVDPLPRLSIDPPARSYATRFDYSSSLSGVFGLRNQRDMQKLARQLYMFDRAPKAEKDDQPRVRDMRDEDSVRIDLLEKPREPGREDELPDAIRRHEEFPTEKEPTPVVEDETTTESQGQEQASLIEPGQDAYSDLLVTLYRQRQAANRQALERAAAKAGEAGRRVMILTPPVEAAPERLVEMVKGSEVVVRGLAGAGKDRFNQQMSVAADNLKQGKFYRAVADYRLAAVIDSANPLALVGMAIARFGAGEPMSAALQFRRAIKILPALMETRLDLPGMMSEQVLQERLDELDARLAEEGTPDASLLFLSALVHQNLQQTDKARVSAEKLKALGEDAPIPNSYAEYVLTGKNTLAKPPAIQPADK